MKIHSAEFVIGAHGPKDMVRDGRPEVAFVGRSNVGKSSLINALLARKGLARTSSTPGRTRAVNYFLIDDRFYVVDLPGYGYAKASKDERGRWARVVEAYLSHPREQLHLVLLIDAKISGSPLDREAVEYFLDFDLLLTVAATKIDRVPRNKRRKRLQEVREFLELPDEIPVVPVSAKSGEGIGDLRRIIAP